MNKKLIFFFVFILVLPAFFIEANAGSLTLKSVQIPVVDYSPKNKLNALKQGLSQSIVKLSANPEVLENEKIKSVLEEVDNYVTKFLYLKRNETLLLDIKFNFEEIKKILKSENIKIHDAKRPTILAWIAIDTDAGVEILGNSKLEEQEKSLLTKSNSIGLPVVLPLLDLSAQVSINANDLINFDFAKITNNSTNYIADAIIIGSIFKFDDTWHYKWKLSVNGLQSSWVDTNQDLDLGFGRLLSNLRNKMLDKNSKNTNLISTDNNDNPTLKLAISGINSLDKFTALENYLQKKFLTKITGKVELVELTNSVAVFRLDTKVDKSVVVDTLNRDKFLIEDSNAISELSDTLDLKIGS